MMKTYLITGGAGFVGSHIAEALVKKGERVKIIDNLSTGRIENIELFIDKVEFIKGDIRNFDLLKEITKNVDIIFHEAALPSVPRSIDNPIASNANNVDGTLNVLYAAKLNNVRRVIYAASSSVYGNSKMLPKVETMNPNPLSPYAVSKYAGELYCKVFYDVYKLETISLRYFNVFGPRQDPDSQYSAVIPKFIKSYLAGKPPVIYGDGEQSRDFTYIDNVVQANLLAANTKETHGETVNIACGRRITINQLADIIRKEIGIDLKPIHKDARIGDVRHSLADIAFAKNLIGYEPIIDVYDGLKRTIGYFLEEWKGAK